MVKRLAILTTTLLAASAIAGGICAQGETANTYYPAAEEFIKPLTVASLTDYAVTESEYAFAERGESKDLIKIYKDGTLTEYAFSEKVTALDCADGVIYYALDDGKVYSLPDKKEAEHAMPEAEAKATIVLGDYIYIISNTALSVVYIDETDHSKSSFKTLEGEYKNLKNFGNTVYAVKENALYKFDGASEEKLSFVYYDYSATQQISVADTAELLQDYTLTFVTVQKGEYMTEVDLTELGEYFTAGKTATAAHDTLALLLCYTGNAAVIAVGEKSFITAKTSTVETSVRYTGQAEFEYATVTGSRIYASPFVIIGTSAFFPATGSIVKIIGKIEHEVLGSAFYEVEYTVDGQTKKGYVTDGFLTEYIIEDNKEPTEVPDPAHSEKNDVRKVILIFMAIVLALAAVGYITWFLTSPKRKGKTANEETEK